MEDAGLIDKFPLTEQFRRDILLDSGFHFHDGDIRHHETQSASGDVLFECLKDFAAKIEAGRHEHLGVERDVLHNGFDSHIEILNSSGNELTKLIIRGSACALSWVDSNSP